jgi:hypothetical protein
MKYSKYSRNVICGMERKKKWIRSKFFFFFKNTKILKLVERMCIDSIYGDN